MANQYKNKVVYNGATLIDLSDTTAVQSDVASGKYFYLATGEKVEGTASGGGDEPSEPTYETIVPLQTINCTIDLSNGAYGGYITPYTKYTQSGEKYRVYYDGAEYGSLTATYYGDGTTYLYVGDVNVMLSSSATFTYPFVIMLYNGSAFYLAVRGSGSHTLQVDKMTSEGSGGGSSMNVQTVQSTDRRNNTALDSVTSLTCSTAGTYDVYWTCARSNTSGTWGSQLYINGTAYGSENTTFSNNVQTNKLTDVTIPANATVAIYGRSRSGYYIYVPQLTIVQTA